MEELIPDTVPAASDWDMGAWTGRQQAFALIASKCSAAQALSLKQMKDSGCYERQGLTWDEFCRRHAGISRVHADRLIGRYNEFGEAYFRLSALARISVEDYRELAPQVDDNCLEIDGEMVAIVPHNAARIRALVNERRARRRSTLPPAFPAHLDDLCLRYRALLADCERQVTSDLHDRTRAYLKSLFKAAVEDWQALLNRLLQLNPRESHFEPRQ